jgi:hypothetical protein
MENATQNKAMVTLAKITLIAIPITVLLKNGHGKEKDNVKAGNVLPTIIPNVVEKTHIVTLEFVQILNLMLDLVAQLMITVNH